MGRHHYLEQEFHERLRSDPRIFGFLESGSLDGIWFWDLEREDQGWMSPRFKKLFGFEDREIENSTEWWRDNIHPEDLGKVLDNLERHKADPSHPFDQIVRFRHRDGSTVWVRSRGVVLRDGHGQPCRVLGAHTDVTHLKVVERELKTRIERSERQYRQMKALVRLGEYLQTCLTEREAERVLATMLPQVFPNAKGCLMLCQPSGTNAAKAVSWGDANFADTMDLDDCWAIRRGRMHERRSDDDLNCAHLEGTEAGSSACTLLSAQGTTFGVLSLCDCDDVTLEVLASTAGDQMALALSNIRLRETLKRQSIRDSLTGLFNRRYLEDTLAREFARVTRTDGSLSVLMLDLDHFKSFNDDFGHVTADRMLKLFATQLQDAFRSSDVVCRYGGEEFLVLLPDCELNEALQRADGVRRRTATIRLTVAGKPCRKVTTSIGVASMPQHASDPEHLLRVADSALYMAKTSGRDRVCTPDDVPMVGVGGGAN